jgi:sensor histidine kinase regulating citrate/malate metabolism
MDFGFQIMNLLFPIVFIAVFAIVIVTLIRNIGQWNKNNHSPRLTVDAQVVSKRTSVTRNVAAANQAPISSTSYYVTFQVASGDRIEFHVHGREYGMLAEGDQGRLSFQGTRYLSFERT